MEVLGFVLLLVWFKFIGMPLHAWSEKTFSILDSCLETVVESDLQCYQGKVVAFAWVRILINPSRNLPDTMLLEVEDVPFSEKYVR